MIVKYFKSVVKLTIPTRLKQTKTKTSKAFKIINSDSRIMAQFFVFVILKLFY